MKREMEILFHSLGLSVLAGSLVWMFMTFVTIFTNNCVVFIEPNPLILSFEIFLTVYGILYLSYIYSKIPKLFQLIKRTKDKEIEINKVWTQEHLKARLSLWKRLLLKINGYVFLRWERREGWTDYLPFYLVKCDKHGYFEDYPHGFSEYFWCQKCEEESKEKWT
jgi:hypothetical protein